jgi:hypothetical protein
MQTMEERINVLLEKITDDYRRYSAGYKAFNPNYTDEKHAQEVAAFRGKLSYEVGKKYIRIVSDGAAYGFIVAEPVGKFKLGDLLKAASWSSPAKNFARGNIFNDDIKPRWTGI